MYMTDWTFFNTNSPRCIHGFHLQMSPWMKHILPLQAPVTGPPSLARTRECDKVESRRSKRKIVCTVWHLRIHHGVMVLVFFSARTQSPQPLLSVCYRPFPEMHRQVLNGNHAKDFFDIRWQQKITNQGSQYTRCLTTFFSFTIQGLSHTFCV